MASRLRYLGVDLLCIARHSFRSVVGPCLQRWSPPWPSSAALSSAIRTSITTPSRADNALADLGFVSGTRDRRSLRHTSESFAPIRASNCCQASRNCCYNMARMSLDKPTNDSSLNSRRKLRYTWCVYSYRAMVDDTVSQFNGGI